MGSTDESFPPTGYEPKDNFLTETYVESTTESMTEQRIPEQRFLEDVDYDDTAIGEMLFEAYREQVYHSQREGLSVGQSSSSMSDRTEQLVVETVAKHLGESHDRTGQPVVETGQEQNLEQAQILTFFWTDRERKSSRIFKRRSKSMNFRLIMTKEVFQKLSETIESQQEELHRAQAEELHRRDQQLFHEQLLKQHSDLREAHEKSLKEVEALKKSQSSTFDTVARRRLIEDQDTIMELTGKIQELQKEINCMNDSRDFQDAESVRSGYSHVTSQPVSFPLRPILGGMLSRSIGMPSRGEGPPSIWDTHGTSGNVFADPVASSTAPYPQELNPWSSGISEPIHSSTAEKNQNRTPVQDQRCQSGPSAKISVIPCEGDSSKNYRADQQRLQISDLHFDKFPTPAMFACWKIRFKTDVCTCSQFPTEALHWIKEVEMAESVDELESSSSIRGIQMPNF